MQGGDSGRLPGVAMRGGQGGLPLRSQRVRSRTMWCLCACVPAGKVAHTVYTRIVSTPLAWLVRAACAACAHLLSCVLLQATGDSRKDGEQQRAALRAAQLHQHQHKQRSQQVRHPVQHVLLAQCCGLAGWLLHNCETNNAAPTASHDHACLCTPTTNPLCLSTQV